MTTTRNELYDLLSDAQAELLNAIEHLQTYVRLTDDRAAEAYIVDHLKIIATANHGFLSRDLNIDDLIERLNDYEADESDD